MKKIIIATESWHPMLNGVVRTLDGIIYFLKKNGFEVTIVHPRLFLNVPIFFYPEFRLAFFPKRKIKKIIEEIKPDYIHIETEDPVGLAVRAVCLEKKLNFTTALTTNFPEYSKIYFRKQMGFLFPYFLAFTKKYISWFHNAGSKTMVCTKTLKEDAESYGLKNVVIRPLGVDTEIFSAPKALPTEMQHNFTHPIFVFAGRIAKEKNIEEFLNCKLPGTKLIIGGGPLRRKLEKRKLENVVFAGWKSGKELVDWLSLADVFVFPSRTDTFGIAILEALACGLPVAAHNVMGPKDIITDGVDGFLDDDLQTAALKCLTLSKEKCREKALLFSWEKSADYFIRNLVKI